MATEKLRVKLTTRIAGIGKEGEIVEVSHAQAKNYLVPKGLGILMDDKSVAEEEARKKKKQDEKRRLVEDRHKIAEKLHAKTLRFELAGSGGKIF
jgi:ribosomal protein L9